MLMVDAVDVPPFTRGNRRTNWTWMDMFPFQLRL